MKNPQCKFCKAFKNDGHKKDCYIFTDKPIVNKMKKKPSQIEEKEPTQNQTEINLFMQIQECVFNLVAFDDESRQRRARALGLLDAMISYKKLSEK